MKENKENIMKEIKKIITEAEFEENKLEDFKYKLYKEIEEVFKHKVIIDERISESAKQI